MEEEKPKSNRGGARAGAGRKKKDKQNESLRIGLRLSRDVYEILQRYDNKTEFIEKAIREKYRRDTW